MRPFIDNTIESSKYTRKSIFKNANNYGYLFILPFFFFMTAFILLPNLFSLFVSFTKWNSYAEMTFVGFKNYITIFNNGLLFKSIFNTLRIMLLALPIGIILSLVLAFVLNQNLVKLAKFFRTAFFMPYITTPVAVGLIFSLFFDYRIGFLNILLLNLGIIKENVFWLSKSENVVFIVSLIVLWKNFGYNMVLFIAGLQTVPQDLYEAAEIDGASLFQKFLHITIPILRPITIFVVITSLIWGLQIFDEPSLLLIGADYNASIATTIGGPDKCVYTLLSYVYEEGFILFRAGMASAVAYLMSILIVIITAVSFKIMNKGQSGL